MSLKMPSLARVRLEYEAQSYRRYGLQAMIHRLMREQQRGTGGRTVSETFLAMQEQFDNYWFRMPEHRTIFTAGPTQRHAYAELLVPANVTTLNQKVLGYCWFTKRFQFLTLAEWDRRLVQAKNGPPRPP